MTSTTEMALTSDSTAVEQVVTTAELLEMIVQNLVMKDVARLVRVCRFWHAMIINSPQIHDLRVLPPLNKRRIVDATTVDGRRTLPDVIIYDTEADIRMHEYFHVIQVFSVDCLPSTPIQSCLVMMEDLNDELHWLRGRALRRIRIASSYARPLIRTDSVPDAYATHPPVQAMAFILTRYFVSGEDRTIRSTIYIKGGIKITDILDAYQALAKPYIDSAGFQMLEDLACDFGRLQCSCPSHAFAGRRDTWPS